MVQNTAGTSADLFLSLSYNPAGQIASRNLDNDAYAWTGHYAVNRNYTVNGRNQYSAAGSASFSYDANGNLISDGTNTYTYDAENRLLSSSNGAALTYDPLGRLYQVTLGGSTTRFVHDGDRIVAEYNGSGTLTRRYVHWVGSDVPLLSYAGTDLSQPSYLHADQPRPTRRRAEPGRGLLWSLLRDPGMTGGTAKSGRRRFWLSRPTRHLVSRNLSNRPRSEGLFRDR